MKESDLFLEGVVSYRSYKKYILLVKIIFNPINRQVSPSAPYLFKERTRKAILIHCLLLITSLTFMIFDNIGRKYRSTCYPVDFPYTGTCIYRLVGINRAREIDYKINTNLDKDKNSYGVFMSSDPGCGIRRPVDAFSYYLQRRNVCT